MRPATSRLATALAAAALVATGCGSAEAPEAAAADALSELDPSLHERLPRSVRDAGELVIGTDPSYAPASSYADDGRTIVGFEPDLAAELGVVLGVDVRFVDVPFTEVLTQVARGDVDLAMSAITDTAEREELVDFVTYFTAGTSVLVQRGNPAGVLELEDLCGHVVAVEAGTVQVDLLERAQAQCGEEPVVVRQHPSNADALLQLRTGRAVAVLNDYPPAAHLTTQERTRSQYQLASTAQYEPGLYGIAVAPEAEELRDVVRDGVDALIRSGAYAEVLERWGVADGAVPRATLNGG